MKTNICLNLFPSFYLKTRILAVLNFCFLFFEFIQDFQEIKTFLEKSEKLIKSVKYSCN